jgi:hypothetical protein
VEKLKELKMLKMIKEWVKTKAHEQWVDTNTVRPRLDSSNGKIFLNSCAGLIEFRPKSVKELSQFRDNWVNKFNIIMEAHNRGVDMSEKFYKLYAEILRSDVKGIRYKGNLRTRLRLKLKWSLLA